MRWARSALPARRLDGLRTVGALGPIGLAALVGIVGLPNGARAELAVVSPAAGSEVELRRPPIVFAGELPPEIERDDIQVLVDGSDLTEFAAWTEVELRLVPPLPMAEGEHVAEVREAGAPAGERLASVSFRIVPPGRAYLRDGRFKDSVKLEVERDKEDEVSVAPHIDGAFKGARSEFGYDITVPHTFALEGESNEFEDPDLVSSFARAGWQGQVGRIGKAENFRESQFVGIKTYRRAAQLGWGDRTPWTLFSNIADALPTVTGERSFEQSIQGSSVGLPVGGDRMNVTVVALSVRDREGSDQSRFSTSSAENGTLFAALLHFELAKDWQLDAELATSDRDVREGPETLHQGDQAFRFALEGKLANHEFAAGFTRVGSRYGNPADPGLSNDREEARVSLARRATSWDYEVRLSSATDGLDGGVDASDELRVGLAVGWKLPHNLKAALEWDRQEVDSAGNDSEQSKFDLSFSRGWKTGELALRAGRTDTERPDQGRETGHSTFKLSGRWTGSGSLALNGAAGLSRLDDTGVETRSEDLFLEPSWKLAANRLRLSLNLGLARRQTPNRTDSERLTGRAGLTWELPGARGLRLGFDTAWSRSSDRIRASRDIDRSASLKVIYSPKIGFGGS